jgi:hypothetical protein
VRPSIDEQAKAGARIELTSSTIAPTDIHIAVTDLHASGKMGWGYGTTVENLGGKPTDLYWGAVYEFADGHYKIIADRSDKAAACFRQVRPSRLQ